MEIRRRSTRQVATNDVLAQEEPNVYRLFSQLLYGAPADRNVLGVDEFVRTIHFAPLERRIFWTEGVYKHSVPLGLSDLVGTSSEKQELEKDNHANSLLLAHYRARLNRRSV